jgi:heme oxygenase
MNCLAQTRLGLTPQSGGAFFDGYGAQTGSHWKAFCTMLSKNADHPTDQGADRCAAPSAYESRQEAIVAGANCTFETLTQWLFPTSLERMAQHDVQVA